MCFFTAWERAFIAPLIVRQWPGRTDGIYFLVALTHATQPHLVETEGGDGVLLLVDDADRLREVLRVRRPGRGEVSVSYTRCAAPLAEHAPDEQLLHRLLAHQKAPKSPRWCR